MPITALDPKTALIVIDLQKGIVSFPLADPIAKIIERNQALLTAFRARNLPVVLVNVSDTPPGRTDKGRMSVAGFPAGWTDLIPELNQQASDITVTKRARSAFSKTGLAERLEGLGVTQVVVTGISTSAGVESTARDAHELGFNVTLPVDAMTDTEAASQGHSVEKVFPRIAEVGKTEDVLKVLQ